MLNLFARTVQGRGGTGESGSGPGSAYENWSFCNATAKCPCNQLLHVKRRILLIALSAPNSPLVIVFELTDCITV